MDGRREPPTYQGLDNVLFIVLASAMGVCFVITAQQLFLAANLPVIIITYAVLVRVCVRLFAYACVCACTCVCVCMCARFCVSYLCMSAFTRACVCVSTSVVRLGSALAHVP
jgi:hypothetical protein